MIILDPGHEYKLQIIDGTALDYHTLVFVKREGEGYPGNVGHRPGTIIQDVLRCCIDRLKYVNNQIPNKLNVETIQSLRDAIFTLELRAASRHDTELKIDRLEIEDLPVGKNGHLLIGAGHE